MASDFGYTSPGKRPLLPRDTVPRVHGAAACSEGPSDHLPSGGTTSTTRTVEPSTQALSST